MDSMLPILIFVGFLVLIAVGAYFSHMAAVRRREALAALAREVGWRFVKDRDYQHDDHFSHFGVFRNGGGRYAYNTLYGDLEIEGRAYAAKMGDFHYETKSTNSKGHTTTHHHHFSYLIVDVPFPGVPSLAIRREGMFDKLGAFFGFDDIDFESAEFSRRFHVKSSDKRFAYDVIDPRMMQFLLDTHSTTVDIERGHCCLSDGSTRWDPQQFKAQAQWAREFFARWPRHVTADLESRV